MINNLKLGIIMYIFITHHRKPYGEEFVPMHIIMSKVLDGNRPEVPSTLENSDESGVQKYLYLMKRCWNQNPRERPAFNILTAEIENIKENIHEIS